MGEIGEKWCAALHLIYSVNRVGRVGKVFRGSHRCYEDCISFASLVFSYVREARKTLPTLPTCRNDLSDI